MPHKRVIGFWNFKTVLVTIAIVSGLYNLTPFAMYPKNPLASILMFLIAYALLFRQNTSTCFYCKIDILNFESHIIVEWKESPESSETARTMQEVMHVSCHANASENNRFRVPGHESFQV